MTNWYYYNTSGEKIAATSKQLKELAQQGIITPETIIETAEGKSAPAGKVKGLTFAETKQPEAEQMPNNDPSANVIPAQTMSETPKQWFAFTKTIVIGGATILGVLLAVTVLAICFSSSYEQMGEAFMVLCCGTFCILIGIGIRQYAVFCTKNDSEDARQVYVGCGTGCLGFCILLFIVVCFAAIDIGMLTEEQWNQRQAELAHEKQQQAEQQAEQRAAQQREEARQLEQRVLQNLEIREQQRREQREREIMRQWRELTR